MEREVITFLKTDYHFLDYGMVSQESSSGRKILLYLKKISCIQWELPM